MSLSWLKQSFLENDNLYNWENTGRCQFMKECKKLCVIALEDQSYSLKSQTIPNVVIKPNRRRINPTLRGHGEKLVYAIHLLLEKGSCGFLTREQVVSVLSELMEFNPKMTSIIADAFALTEHIFVEKCATECQQRFFCAIVEDCKNEIKYIRDSRIHALKQKEDLVAHYESQKNGVISIFHVRYGKQPLVRLKAQVFVEMVSLKRVLVHMTGLKFTREPNYTCHQLEAMGGGWHLRCQAGYFSQFWSNNKPANIDTSSVSKVTVSLSILMAQLRKSVIYEEGKYYPPKTTGRLYDDCQDTFIQLGAMLDIMGFSEDYTTELPSFESLLKDYQAAEDSAFYLLRPKLCHEIIKKYNELSSQNSSNAFTSYMRASQHVLHPLVVKSMKLTFKPLQLWENFSPYFYVTFWSLTLPDLEVPTHIYSVEIGGMKEWISRISSDKTFSESENKREQDRCASVIKKLEDEQINQTAHVERVIAKLAKEKEIWFKKSDNPASDERKVIAFLDHCIYPRCLFTAPDALFCAKFIMTAHSISTPHFATMACLDKIFFDMSRILVTVTENEAIRYGKFLCQLLKTILKWNDDETAFEQECKRVGFTSKIADTSFQNYKVMALKWQKKITQSLYICLSSKEYIQTRNSFIVLKNLLPCYPKVLTFVEALERVVEKVKAIEKRNRRDLYEMAKSYKTILKSVKSRISSEQDMNQNPVEPRPFSQASSSSSTSTVTENSTTSAEEGGIDGSSSCRKMLSLKFMLAKELRKQSKKARTKGNKCKNKSKNKDKPSTSSTSSASSPSSGSSSASGNENSRTVTIRGGNFKMTINL